jgi:hypothetical protein
MRWTGCPTVKCINDACHTECQRLTLTKYPTAGQSPAEARKTRKYDFNCACGEQWDSPSWGDMPFLTQMRCDCGEVVEAR